MDRVLTDFLGPILDRKRAEIARRRRHRIGATAAAAEPERGPAAVAALTRGSGPPRVIAEIKRRSPSAGVIRKWVPGDAVDLARAYAAGGASAVSVLCDGPGFGGSALDLRRVTRAASVPLLFKEFVLDEVQIDLALRSGASMVLLLVRVLGPEALHDLVEAVRARGLEPVVEAADAEELECALTTRATIVGVNARNLRTFEVDVGAASSALARVPKDRIAVHMSGIRTRDDFLRAADSRADAVLIGESLMRATDPAAHLRSLLG